MLNAKIPATVITGFLGAGKTTMIRNMLQNAGGKRIALIINEFGDLGVDGDVLKGCGIETCTEDDIVELTNGCICCTVADDFVPTMTALLERENRPDHIVIETSGLALPQPLVAAFNWPDIKTQVTVDGVVTVRLHGHCHGCAAADLTLQANLAQRLRTVPGYVSLNAVGESDGCDDHAGTTRLRTWLQAPRRTRH
mgnify:CR=1 FL=1